MITAAILYLFRYRMDIEISEEEALQEAQAGTMTEGIEVMWETHLQLYSDSAVLKDALDIQVGKSESNYMGNP